MKRDTVNYFWVGLFVMAMFVLLMASLFIITGRQGGAVSYFAYYDNIGGVAEGTTVTYSGYQVGRVNTVKLIEEEGRSGYRLELAIRPDWQIPADSIARIRAPGLLSDKQIDIQPGRSKANLKAGATIQGADEAQMMAAIGQAATDLSRLSQDTLQPMVEEIGGSLVDISEELQGEIPKLMTGLDQLIATLQNTAEQIGGLASQKNKEHLSTILANGDDISQELLILARDIHGLRQQMGDLLGDGRQLLGQTTGLVQENRPLVQETMTNLQGSSAQLNQRLATTLYHLEETSRNLSELSQALRRDPGLLLGGGQPEDNRTK